MCHSFKGWNSCCTIAQRISLISGFMSLLEIGVALTQDVNMAILNTTDALLDWLVTANVQWKQCQGLPIGIPCCLHQLVLLLQVPHSGNDWQRGEKDKYDIKPCDKGVNIVKPPSNSVFLHFFTITLITSYRLFWSLGLKMKEWKGS